MNSDISDKVLEKIEQQKIKPKAKWEFLLKDSLIWFVAFCSVVVGGLAVSVVIFLIQGTFSFETQAVGLVKKVVLLIPYFWLLILAIFLLLAYVNFKYTKKGYKINPYLLFISSILVSVILGSGAYFLGFGETIESYAYDKVPLYKNLMHEQFKPMLDPQMGMLGGIVKNIEEASFVVEDFERNNWQVTVNEELQNVVPQLKLNFRVLVFGQVTEEFIFEAEEIKPMLPGQNNGMFEPGERKYLKQRTN